MRKIIICCIFSAMHFFVFAQDQLLVDANASVRQLEGEFNRIKISSGIKLVLNQSAPVAMAISASQEKYKDDIKTVIENKTLNIYYEAGNNWNTKNRQLIVYLSFKELEELKASGAAEIVVIGEIRLDNLKLKMSGASEINANLNVQLLEIDLSGASEARLRGETDDLSIECSGASDLNAYGLTAEKCKANASGASDIHITVNKELIAVASGASDIFYKGNADITNIKSSGSSDVNKKY